MYETKFEIKRLYSIKSVILELIHPSLTWMTCFNAFWVPTRRPVLSSAIAMASWTIWRSMKWKILKRLKTKYLSRLIEGCFGQVLYLFSHLWDRRSHWIRIMAKLVIHWRILLYLFINSHHRCAALSYLAPPIYLCGSIFVNRQLILRM